MTRTRTLINNPGIPGAVVLLVGLSILTVARMGLFEEVPAPVPAVTAAPTATSTDVSPISGPTLLTPAVNAVLPAGQPVTISGRGTAPEGTLLLQTVDNDTGAVVDDRHVHVGANGHDGPFTATVALPPGMYTVTAWVPDDSDGESGRPDPSTSRTFTISK